MLITKPNSATIFSAFPLDFSMFGDFSNAYRSSLGLAAFDHLGRRSTSSSSTRPDDIAIIFLGISQALPTRLELALVAYVLRAHTSR